MSVSGGPKIVTDGLICYLDPANPDSYPGNGNTWYDLSGVGNDFIFNSASANSSWDGTWPAKIYHAGTAEISSSNEPLTSNPSDGTFIAWVSASTNTNSLIIHSQPVGSYYMGAVNTTQVYSTGVGPSDIISLNAGETRPSQFPNNACWFTGSGEWIMFSCKGADLTNWSTFELGTYGASFTFVGNYGIIMFYDRELSVTELKQNYKALRGRYNT